MATVVLTLLYCPPSLADHIEYKLYYCLVRLSFLSLGVELVGYELFQDGSHVSDMIFKCARVGEYAVDVYDHKLI